ncbi:MAG: hypothetical protein HZB47_00900 [Nitrosomonadales bacterium]|nr:hypothetical protein [Nitrosomonadales bacterium]
MNFVAAHIKLFIALLVVALSLMFYASSDSVSITEKNFVGKWKSSKLETPIYLYANGEWEIKTDKGAVLQYGIWQYKGDKIIWSFKVNHSVGHDANPVLAATPTEFRLGEADGSTTTFSRLDQSD